MSDNLVRPKQAGEYTAEAWEGSCELKPWQYSVQLVIPHLGDIRPLKTAIQLWRLQTVRPYICIVDTGSSFNYLRHIEALRADDVEIHYLRGHGYRHASEPVSVAIDFASARCMQEYQFLTHDDVFPMRRDLIADFVERCSRETPVVGYQISPRDHVAGAMSALWKGMVGHTATCLHYPTIRDLGITWSLDRGYSQFDLRREIRTDMDTEIPFNLHAQVKGIKPVLMGDDRNFVRDTNRDFDHFRSLISSALYSKDHFEKASQWMEQAIMEGKKRIAEWTQGE
jgi:hypothetical protein